MRKIISALFAVALANLGCMANVQASLLAIADNFLSGKDTLYSLDTTTRTATVIGSTTVPQQFVGLAVDSDGTVYAVTDDSPSDQLFRINSATGAATLIGSLGLAVQEGDVAIDPVTGVLYLAGAFPDSLFSVNKATGAATLIGPLGSAGRDVSAMVFMSGVLYAVALNNTGSPDALGMIDTSTGLFTNIGLTGTDCGAVAGLARDPANGNTYLACPSVQFGTDNQLYTVNLSTGAATLVGSIIGTNGPITGLSSRPAAIPEPASIALLVLGLATIAASRRRKLN